MADEVDVKFGAQLGGLSAGVSQFKSQISSISAPLSALRGELAAFGAAFAAAFSVRAIAGMAEHFAKLGEDTERAAARLGATTEEIGRLNTIAAITGTSADGMSRVFERLQLQLSKNNTGPAVAALQALRIEASGFVSLPIPQQMEAIAEKVSKFADGGNKTALVMALLGRGGAEMIPFLNQGAEGFRKLGEVAQRAGVIMSGATVAAFGATDDAIDELKLSLQGAGIAVFSVFRPAIDGLVKIMTNLVQTFTDSVANGGVFGQLLNGLAVAVQGVAVALAVVIAAIETLWEIAKTVVYAVAEIFVGLGKVIYNTFTFNFSGAAEAFETLKGNLEGRAKVMASNMEGTVKRMVDNIKATLGGASVPEFQGPNKPKPNAPGLPDIGGATSAAKARIESELRLEQIALETKKAIWGAAVEQYRMTEQQKFALVMDATEKSYQKERELLQREAEIGGLKVEQRREVLNKIAELEARHRLEMIKLDNQAIAAAQAQIQQYTDALSSSIGGQLRGLLAGTVKFKDAMKAVFGDMIIFVIQQFIKMGLQWVASQIAMTLATQTGAAARATAELTAGKAGAGVAYAEAVAAVLRSSVQTFAGVFANLSPVMGPAAAGPAAASQAAVASMVGAMPPPLETGAWDIPGTMLATLHRGETVVPAAFAPQVRSMFGEGGGGRGDRWDVSISATDGDSFRRLLAREGDTVLKMIKKKVRGGARMPQSGAPV